MASFTPIKLSGDNLGQRHRHLNSLVRKAKESVPSSRDIIVLPEESAVDRLFKIDLAIELKHVDYIIYNLKDDDMLYVSRALKSTWLIDHRDIINPRYLEKILFPKMIMPAVTKMKHWLYINLRDQTMCQEFYQYYKENTFEFAIKFLSHCGHEFILAEAPKILNNLSPHLLKVLCEKCPTVAKVYFDSLKTDEDVKTRYLKQDKTYYNSVKCVLKSDANMFLDITEKYFNMNTFNRFSPLATDYILRYHKTRFTNKSELYVAYFLHIPTLAARLSVEECQEVVLKLARASYLQSWFEYKVVEPLIKRLSPGKRAAFKTRVFVDKDVGECEDKWPYKIPISPKQSDSGVHIFDDQDLLSPIRPSSPEGNLKCCNLVQDYDSENMVRKKTDLDLLFDEFRFIDFNRALHDLGQRLVATSSTERRCDIFLVLVSKTGGRTDAVAALLRLAARHRNEPPHTRACILRSLVKRANVWRLPADVWAHFLDFGHGLGLDGTRAKAACREGLHAVVIRQLLSGEYEQAVFAAFMKDLARLAEAGDFLASIIPVYSLNVEERQLVALGLQNMLVAVIMDLEPELAVDSLGTLLDILKIYRIRVERTSPAVQAVMALALRDADVARPLLKRLYKERIARRELLRLNMEFRKDEAALVNALRHDPSALEPKRVVDILAARRMSFDRFTAKLVVYFDQKQGFTVNLKNALKEKLVQQQKESCKKVKLAVTRPLASLLYKDFENELHELDAAGKQSVKLAAALRACAHRARPVVNLAEWGWRKAGVKAVATRATRCREIERGSLIHELAAERRTVRVALALSKQSSDGLVLDVFASAAKLRPVTALRAALSYFRHHGDSSDLRVWDIVKPLFSSVDLTPRQRLCSILTKTHWVPSTIKSDYCVALSLALQKIFFYDFQFFLRRNLFEILLDGDLSIENILLEILDDAKNIPDPLIFVKYLLLSRNEDDVMRRFMKIGNRFLERLETIRCVDKNKFERSLDDCLMGLKYNSAFLNTKFSSCLTVIERILAWLQKFLPNEEHFKNYSQIHLTMLYFKSVRQSMKQMPEVFADPKRRKSEGVEAVGFVFGTYIVKEVAGLVSTYFDSIIELYTDALFCYLNRHFEDGISRKKFVGFILKGILAEGVGIQRRMAVYILGRRVDAIDKETRKDIEKQMLKDKDIQIFVHFLPNLASLK